MEIFFTPEYWLLSYAVAAVVGIVLAANGKADCFWIFLLVFFPIFLPFMVIGLAFILVIILLPILIIAIGWEQGGFIGVLIGIFVVVWLLGLLFPSAASAILIIFKK